MLRMDNIKGNSIMSAGYRAPKAVIELVTHLELKLGTAILYLALR